MLRVTGWAAGLAAGVTLAVSAGAADASTLLTGTYQVVVYDPAAPLPPGKNPFDTTPEERGGVTYTGQFKFRLNGFVETVTAGAAPGQIVRTWTVDGAFDSLAFAPEVFALPSAPPGAFSSTQFESDFQFSRTETNGVADGDGLYRFAVAEATQVNGVSKNGWGIFLQTHGISVGTLSVQQQCPFCRIPTIGGPSTQALIDFLGQRQGQLSPTGRYANDFDYQVVGFQVGGERQAKLGRLRFSDVAVQTAVPEPGTWLLMIGGFGLAGAQLRRRMRARAHA